MGIAMQHREQGHKTTCTACGKPAHAPMGNGLCAACHFGRNSNHSAGKYERCARVGCNLGGTVPAIEGVGLLCSLHAEDISRGMR